MSFPYREGTVPIEDKQHVAVILYYCSRSAIYCH